MRKTGTIASRSARTAKEPASASTLEKIREQRLIKFTQQNERLRIELERIKQTHVSLDDMKHTILDANARVRAKLEALPSRLAVQVSGAPPAEAERLMRLTIREALLELLYEREQAARTKGESTRRTAKKGTV
jgi:small-conductance mechanosensitive channel